MASMVSPSAALAVAGSEAEGRDREKSGRDERAHGPARIVAADGDDLACWGMEAHEDSATDSAGDGRSKDVRLRAKVAW